MAYEKKPNSGSLWDEKKENISKRTGERYEYYGGDAKIQCPHCGSIFDMWITGFYNILKTGKKVFDMTFKEKKPRPEGAASDGMAPSQDTNDIPF